LENLYVFNRIISRVFIGVDLGTSIGRKSTGLAYLVEQNGKPLLESPPLHIISDDALILSSIIQISKNSSLKKGDHKIYEYQK
jgi:hypothetical protein